MGNLFSVGNVAAIANLVEKEQLREANSRTQASTALAYVIGPILAGAICARFGTATALWVDAGSFAVSATSMALVRFGANEAPSRVKEGGPISWLAFASYLRTAYFAGCKSS
jgi:MFS family permease